MNESQARLVPLHVLAKELGIDRRTLQAAARLGQLPVTQIARTYYTTAEAAADIVRPRVLPAAR